jgi:HPt (histidine-containing phosphotransfer) domain-containing protein
MKGDAERFLAQGFDAYLPKPFRLGELVELVERLGGIAEPPAIDRAAFLDRVGGDYGIMREVAATFCADLPRRMAAIHAAIELGNAQEVERAAHSLRGAAGVIGAARAAEIAGRLESEARAGSLDAAPVLYRQLDSETARVLSALGPSASSLEAA